MTAGEVVDASARASKGKRLAPAAPKKKRDDAQESPGLAIRERLLAGGGLSPDRLPMLRVALDETASAFEQALRRLGLPSPQVAVESLVSARAADAQIALEAYALTATYGGAEPDARVAIGAERKFVFAMVEGLFGADGSEPFYDEERALTGVETRLGRLVLDRLAKTLQASLLTVAGAAPGLDPIEAKPEPAGAARRGGSMLICRLRLSALGCDSQSIVAIPQGVLEPLREALSADPAATIQSVDPLWAQRMKARVTQTELSLAAVMERRDLTLGDVARFEVGQIVELPVTPTGLIALECEGQTLFWCEIGQKDGAYTIRIAEFVDKEQEFIDDMLGA
ncbi:FliM/FliN family flagellar motor switch protein [Methylosinus sp. Sm6]|uniref:FliM/FliN family flagellar motor switch protein n=1 Tax=Methylosinus sp. Sm6 TaxID=2866948 RepID=UPI001C9992D1|nr:FliM/FliN family flagellar motor switch protein [Methylosinus sp. Sm6]MBY6242163.1 FliM/FliN family flagellar motor switch protein [Methylosinus sp. Sm6]